MIHPYGRYVGTGRWMDERQEEKREKSPIRSQRSVRVLHQQPRPATAPHPMPNLFCSLSLLSPTVKPTSHSRLRVFACWDGMGTTYMLETLFQVGLTVTGDRPQIHILPDRPPCSGSGLKRISLIGILSPGKDVVAAQRR